MMIVAALFATTWVSPPAQASCAPFTIGEALARAEVLFVGVATANREHGSYTKFRVEEVWKGPDLAPGVWVQGGQDQGPWPFNNFAGVSSSNDIRFDVGERYLVATNAETFTTSVCSGTRGFEPSLREYAPSSVRGPTRGGLSGADAPPSLLLLNASAILASVGLGLMVVFARLCRRDRN